MKVTLLIKYIIVNNIETNFLKSCCIEKKQKNSRNWYWKSQL